MLRYNVLNFSLFSNNLKSKTGATALHVASAKGYLKVMGLLMQGGAAVNSQGKKCTIADCDLMKQISLLIIVIVLTLFINDL